MNGSTALGVVLAAVVVLGGAREARADTPPFLPWSTLLPGLMRTYEPSSSNVCSAGQVSCVHSVIAEMTDRARPLETTCNHDAVFALTYLRTTEQYLVSATTPGFFEDAPFVHHQDALFASYYFDAWDRYHAGDRAGTPRAWRIAFEAAEQKKVAGLGNLLLGMSAHVNRDLPYVLAEIGLVKPDGSSRKRDHDEVNRFLNLVIEPLVDEVAARFDPTVDDFTIDGTTLDEAALLQILVGWRELAWRNAELLVAAPTPAARALVAAEIERVAAVEANLVVLATAYLPVNLVPVLGELTTLLADPGRVVQAQLDHATNLAHGLLGTLLVPGAVQRDQYCATHR